MASRLVIRASLAALLFAPTFALAAAGDLDPTFANAGRIAIPSLSLGSDLVLQSDGKTVATQFYGFNVARFGTNGFLDAAFGSSGISDTASPNALSEAVAVQPDGYIVVAGQIFVTGTDSSVVVGRLDPDGHVDATFGTGGIVTAALTSGFDFATAVALQPDGKILVAGVANSNNNGMFFLVRYDAGGVLDGTFGSGGVVTIDYSPGLDKINDILVQPDGAILAVGLSNSMSYIDMAVLRFEDDGDLDPTFGVGGVAEPAYDAVHTTEGLGVMLEPDGKILVSGYASYYFALARFDTAGELDPTFGDGGSRIYYGVGSTGYAYDLAVQPNGSILLGGARAAGTGGGRDCVVSRVLANGDIDATFGAHGVATMDINNRDNIGQGMVLQSDGKIVIAGTAEVAPNDYRLALARFLGTGPCEPGPAPDADGDYVCDAADLCLNVANARDFVADPAATVEIKRDLDKPGKDQVKARATFVLPSGGFASFDPLTQGARVVVRRADTSTMIDAVLPAGAFAGAGTAGWKANGAGNRWKFLDRTGTPAAGITRMDVRDVSKKLPDGVAVQVIGKHANYDVYSVAYPLSMIVVLGNSSASAAGLCGEGGIPTAP